MFDFNEPKKNEEFFETGEQCFDEYGNAYYYVEKISVGHIVRPVYTEFDRDRYGTPSEPYEVEGEPKIIRNNLYHEVPTKVKETRIKLLETEIEELEKRRDDLQEQRRILDGLTSKTPDEIIKEKLKDYPQADILFKALKGDMNFFYVYNNEVCGDEHGIVCYDTKNKKVFVIVKTSEGYVDNSDSWRSYYPTREEAEKSILNKINSMFYSNLMKVKPIVEKYGLPDNWDEIVKKAKEDELNYLLEDKKKRQAIVEQDKQKVVDIDEKISELKNGEVL